MSATAKQIETLNSLEREINGIIAEAKKSANYKEYEDLIERALSGLLVSSDGGGTIVEAARKSGDKAIYSTVIGMLIKAKKSVFLSVSFFGNLPMSSAS